MRKRILSRLLGAIGFATLLMGGGATLTAWSPSASAQTVSCNATTCFYGPICPDAWGGCYYYTWRIASAHNTWEEKAGIANLLKLCTDPDNPDPSQCVYLTSKVDLVTGEGPNVAIQCRAPGSKTCKGGGCGGSPESSGTPFEYMTISYSQSVTELVDSKGCVKEKGGGAIKCSKTNTLTILEGNAQAAAELCPNANWQIVTAIPLRFRGTTMATGPLSKQNPTPWSSTAVAKCVLQDAEGDLPGSDDYQLNPDLTKNRLKCEHESEETAAQ